MKSAACVAILATALMTACTQATAVRDFPDDQHRRIYLNLAGETLPDWSDERLLTEAQSICSALDDDPSTTGWVKLVKRYTDDGLSGRDTGMLIAYAVGSLCAEHEDALPL